MNNDLSNNKVRLFYNDLQINLNDTRSNSGRKHELAFVMTLLVISILRSYGHLNMSKIHRNMVRNYENLCVCLQKDIDRCISRVQLSRILSSLDYISFLSIYTNKQDPSEWHAVDGKELRGSIDLNSKDTRGLSIVYALSHLTNQQQLLGYYDGTKESEKEVVKDSITKMPDAAKISLDAMHNSAGLLSDIEQSDRFYLTQIKGNQKHLMEDLIHTSEHLLADNMLSEIDKSHGRIDQRDYEIYAINPEMLQPRWSESGICNMIKVTRSSCSMSTGKCRNEERYYITNYNGDIAEIAGAIRNHWKIEVMNRIRDVNFGEDNFKSLNHGIQKSMSAIILFICNGLMRINNENNISKLREDFASKPEEINKFFAA